MHRPGSDPLDMRAEDFLCDFCGEHWSEERPMVEGHHGSLACGPCLTAAFRATWLAAGAVAERAEGDNAASASSGATSRTGGARPAASPAGGA